MCNIFQLFLIVRIHRWIPVAIDRCETWNVLSNTSNDGIENARYLHVARNLARTGEKTFEKQKETMYRLPLPLYLLQIPQLTTTTPNTYWKFTISPTTLCYPQTKKLRFVFLLIIPLDVPWNPRKVAQSVNLALEWLVHRETRLSIVSCHGTETITGSIPLRSRCVKRYRGSHRAFVENEAGMRELEFGALNVSWTVAIGRRWWNERTDRHRTRGKAIWRWFVMHARRSPPK